METDSFFSEKSFEYFKQPIPSSILYPEMSGLNHFTSTYPLPAAFKEYKFIKLKINIHEDVCDFSETDEDKVLDMNVNFFYVYNIIYNSEI